MGVVNRFCGFFGVLLFVLGISVLVLGQQQSEGNVVTLQVNGAVFEGTRDQLDKDRRVFYSFRGIPYATAERFEEPVLKDVQGTIRATNYQDKCPQWSQVGNRSTGSETNCLNLNIFTPSVPAQSSRAGVVSSRGLLPVLVYIHGGGYSYGWGGSVGPRRLMKQDVVLVTINYRLGVLGFLSTGDEALPGNYGLLDQIKGLEWVKKYIRGFGGNPEMVTIFGDSAGAASVHLLMLSQRAIQPRLFQRAILQSGSALCGWSVEPNPREYAEVIGEALECPTGNSQELRECLEGKSTDEIVKAQNAQQKLWVFPIRAAPVVDNVSRADNPVLTDTPQRLMQAGAYAQIPVIAGINQDEGLMGYTNIHLEVGVENFKNKEYFEEELVPRVVSNLFHDQRANDVVSKAVLSHYFEGIEFDTPQGLKKAVAEFTELIGDTAHLSCHWDTLEKFSQNRQTMLFSYVFTHKTIHSPSIISRNIQSLRSAGVQNPLFDFGVSHSDELFYLFDPVNVIPGNVNTVMRPPDERVSDIITKIWASFALNGNPAAALQSYNLQAWRPISPGNINYYNLTSVSAPMGSDFRKGEALFWLRTVPYLRELGETIESLSCYPILFYIFLGLFILFLIITIILAVILYKKRTSQKVNL